ncbi:MAG: hypothetical protein ACT4QG_00335 [Sporichthyaceae bacterium]
MISKDTHRTFFAKQRRKLEDEGPWAPRMAAIPPQSSPARAALAQIDPVVAAASEPIDPAAEADMEAAWRAYGEVVDVLGAMTNAARLAERGVCADSQLGAIDLLASQLDVAWARWEAAHRRVIDSAPRYGHLA